MSETMRKEKKMKVEKKAKEARMRNAVFTSFKTETDLQPDMSKIKFMIYQAEICPTTKKKHFQGYVEFKDNYGFTYGQKYIGDENCHIEKRKGTRTEAIQYVTKSETSIENSLRKFGDVPSLRKKNDERKEVINIFEEWLKMLKNGCNISDLPAKAQILYNKSLTKIKEDYDKEKYMNIDFKRPNVIILCGKAGCGKTSEIYKKHDKQNIYKLMKSNKTENELWFDGYNPSKHNVLLIDDFYGWIRYNVLLELLDGYPMQLQIKGSITFKNWDHVYITSNVSNISKWYPNIPNLEALERRISYFCVFDKEKNIFIEQKPKKEEIIKEENNIIEDEEIASTIDFNILKDNKGK